MNAILRLARDHYLASKMKAHRKEYLEMWKVEDAQNPETLAKIIEDFEYLDTVTAKVYSTFC